ncbi:regulatory protein SipA [cf. Phormidesmis sp. LEGE 11477]|uniref:regulatory protein SipA n=1 Tax=cf. Phormidesmis sp. LEGE 11477 TaxID=1828680 RepID=UPI00187E9548|nr:DUF3148 domain-containing protein [cf. Phormidesmis sp. LEGE 11477]MBE9060900.1 DUF3148 domain-containing protein [cf. Phormidesmis sp. LEGE 11477]
MPSAFNVGDRIRLHTRPPYLKSAETMPMLRPPDLVEVGEEGTILTRQPGGYLGVRFARGKFLIDAQYIEPVESPAESSTDLESSPE